MTRVLHDSVIVPLLLLTLLVGCSSSNDDEKKNPSQATGGSSSGGNAGQPGSGGSNTGGASGGTAGDGGSTSLGGYGGGGNVSGSAPVVTYAVAEESDAGMDGGIAWQSVFLLNDGRIASVGTGNHADNQSNAVRCIDPMTTPGSVTSYDLFPWTQSTSPPDYNDGYNLYVTNYDNHPSIYLPPDNRLVWAGHGVFDIAQEEWILGNRPPFDASQTWTKYVDDSDAQGINSTYNPSVAWCEKLGLGVWFGEDGGGYGSGPYDLVTIEPNPNGSAPWRAIRTSLNGQGLANLEDARNTAVCIEQYLYVGGPDLDGGAHHFYKIDLSSMQLVKTLDPWPTPSGENFPQMVYDKWRNRLVVIGEGLFLFDLASEQWTDVTPSDWVGYHHVGGVYHPGLDAIFFRGITPSGGSSSFEWHKITFK